MKYKLQLDEFCRTGRQCAGLEGIKDSAPNILKEKLLISSPDKEMPILKNGIALNFTSDGETKIVGYITEKQHLILEFSTTNVRRNVFHIAKRSGRKNDPSIIYKNLCV
jgi:hypothetical protein